jgi:hypothetical protein
VTEQGVVTELRSASGELQPRPYLESNPGYLDFAETQKDVEKRGKGHTWLYKKNPLFGDLSQAQKKCIAIASR